MRKGFTLIELLIVIAIIAILALIAIPNFLEAQVRSRVARASADMRSLASAIEAYNVDYSRHPISFQEGVKLGIVTENPNPDTRYRVWNFLTTPIAYLTSIPQDPFMDKTGSTQMPKSYHMTFNCYEYQRNDRDTANDRLSWEKGYYWHLRSVGPSKIQEAPFQAEMLGKGIVDHIYDPTNGTMSEGFIVRTNKGEYHFPYN